MIGEEQRGEMEMLVSIELAEFENPIENALRRQVKSILGGS